MRRKVLTFALLALFVSHFISAIFLGSLNVNFYEQFYVEHNIAEQIKISHDDLMSATQQLLHYVTNKASHINVEVVVDDQSVAMFNQREIDHMVDVKVLFNYAMLIQITGYVLFIIISYIIYLLAKKEFIKDLLVASQRALALILGIVLALGLFAIIDFNSFWNLFHEVLFTNDLWLLNPLTDRMILMVPLPFFKKLVTYIVLYWAGSILLHFILIKSLSLRSKL